MIKQYFVAATLAACCIGAGPTSRPRQRIISGRSQYPDGDTYGAIAKMSAEVYVCSFESYALDHGESPDVLYDRGRVTLKIEQVIRGQQQDTLMLPYSVLDLERPHVGHGYMGITIWPDPSKIDKGTLFLVVAVPNAYDELAGDMPDMPSAAQVVYKLTGLDDPMVATYQKIIDTETLKAQPLVNALATEIESKEIMLRQFAVYTAADLPSDQSATLMIKALEYERRTFPVLKDRNPTISEAISNIPFSYLPEDSRRILAEFIKFTVSSDPAERDFYVQKTDVVMTRLNNRKDSPAALMMSPEDAAQLRVAATATLQSDDASPRNDAQEILGWLNAAPATQSAAK